MQLYDLQCPNCGAPLADIQDETNVHCRFCGGTFNLHRSLCPGCGFIDLEENLFCTQCGTTIVRTCPHCNQENWGGVEQCGRCGRPLDIFEIMTQSRVRDTRARLQAQQREAFVIKRREAAQAEARMERFREMDRQRLEELALRTAQKRKRELQVVGGILLIAALFILVIIVVSLFSMMGQ